jgi:predicted permease
MEALEIMLRNVLVFVLLAVPGFLLVKTKILKSEHSAVLSKVLLYLGLPFLVFKSTLGISFGGGMAVTLLIVTAFGILYSLAWFFLSKPFTKLEKEDKKQGMMRFSCILSNNGFLGIPLAEAVFPDQPLIVTFVVIINIITNAFIYTLGVYLITGDKSAVSVKKALLNPVLIAFALGFIVNLSGLPKHVPEITSYSGYFGNIVTPLSMMILGMKLAGVSFKTMFGSWKTYYVAAVKLLIFPVVAAAIAIGMSCLFMHSDEFVLGIFIAFAMPTAALCTTIADNYGGDVEGAVSYTLGTTIISVATIPLLYWALVAIL